jgi:hypothetical protein
LAPEWEPAALERHVLFWVQGGCARGYTGLPTNSPAALQGRERRR